MKKILLVFAAGFVMTACEQKSKEVITDKNDDTIMVDNKDANQVSLENDLRYDIVGTYHGVLPCASCEGIKTKITLNNDGTFSKYEEYLGEDNHQFTEAGKYRWSEDRSYITLYPENDSAVILKYKIVDGKIIQLGQDGQMIEDELADAYVLKKE